MNPLEIPYSTGQTDFAIPVRKGEAIGGRPWRLLRRRAAKPASPSISDSIEYACRSVAQALADPRWDFRTVRGIAEETGLSEASVKQLLEEHQLGRKPWGRVEDDRYTARDRPVSMRERLSLLTSYIAKRPG